jgi:cation:H+ antiporter
MGVKIFIKDLIKIVFNIAILLVASYWVVISAQFFAKNLDVSIIFIGILITGLGNALPEIYFTVISARRGETWMILGDLMGAVIFPATLVLGIVALISPIYIYDFSHFYIARLFLIISAILFAFFIRTNKKISFKEGLSLLFIYILFIIVEIFQK